MGGDPDQITEEMRPVNAQSFGLIYTSPLMLLVHRLGTEQFRRGIVGQLNGFPVLSRTFGNVRVFSSSAITYFLWYQMKKQLNISISPACCLISIKFGFWSMWDCRLRDFNICHDIPLKYFNLGSSPTAGLDYFLTSNEPHLSSCERGLRLLRCQDDIDQ